jgi:hypothetical protein
MKEIKYTVLFCVFVRSFVIPFYYGSGTVINYGSDSTRQKVTVPTDPVPVPEVMLNLCSRIRPRTSKFLANISHLYEFHICTFGARLYAHTIAAYLGTWKLTHQLVISVADPNPSDPYVFGPPGSGSISQKYGSGSGSFYHQAKIVRKTLIPTAL